MLLMIRMPPSVRHVTGPQRFRAVAYTTPAGKIVTDLYLRVGGRAVLLGLKDHSSSGGVSISVEHPSPVRAKKLAEMVARSLQSPKGSNQSSGTIKAR